jgi:hypothetical protein
MKKQQLNEKLITFGNKRPKYDNIVLLAGGAGSGKGFILSHLVGIDGKIIDTDEFKKHSLQVHSIKYKLRELGVPVDDMDFGSPKHLDLLHQGITSLGVENKMIKNLMGSMNNRVHKDNLIFDTTLKNFRKLESISFAAERAGYDKENIHIVWILTPMETAKRQNKSRPRRVADEILINIHLNVGDIMSQLINNPSLVRKYADGDFWIVFNDGYNDTILQNSILNSDVNDEILKKFSKGNGGWIKEPVYVKIKEKGKKIKSVDQITGEYYKKILQYVPNPELFKAK